MRTLLVLVLIGIAWGEEAKKDEAPKLTEAQKAKLYKAYAKYNNAVANTRQAIMDGQKAQIDFTSAKAEEVVKEKEKEQAEHEVCPGNYVVKLLKDEPVCVEATPKVTRVQEH